MKNIHAQRRMDHFTDTVPAFHNTCGAFAIHPSQSSDIVGQATWYCVIVAQSSASQALFKNVLLTKLFAKLY
jgi:hypothetical protein